MYLKACMVYLLVSFLIEIAVKFANGNWIGSKEA